MELCTHDHPFSDRVRGSEQHGMGSSELKDHPRRQESGTTTTQHDFEELHWMYDARIDQMQAVFATHQSGLHRVQQNQKLYGVPASNAKGQAVCSREWEGGAASIVTGRMRMREWLMPHSGRVQP